MFNNEKWTKQLKNIGQPDSDFHTSAKFNFKFWNSMTWHMIYRWNRNNWLMRASQFVRLSHWKCQNLNQSECTFLLVNWMHRLFRLFSQRLMQFIWFVLRSLQKKVFQLNTADVTHILKNCSWMSKLPPKTLPAWCRYVNEKEFVQAWHLHEQRL